MIFKYGNVDPLLKVKTCNIIIAKEENWRLQCALNWFTTSDFTVEWSHICEVFGQLVLLHYYI